MLHPNTSKQFPGNPVRGVEPHVLPLGVVFKSKQLQFYICLFSPDLPVAAQAEKISSAVNPFRRPAQPLQVLPVYLF